jgi:ribonuclease G
VVNATSAETRVALVEDGIISELHIERNRDRGVVGNIYKGKVVRVLPGMQAAFVDIAQEKAGFLHISDYHDFEEEVEALTEGDGDVWPPPRNPRRKPKTIEEVLQEGQEIIVQVAKEPMGTKGARLTGQISLPGRYAVFMPTVSHIGISKRIEGDRERKRLRRVVEEARPPGAGFIVRTVSEGVSDDKLLRDMQLLVRLWQDILEKVNRVKAPYLLYEEPDLMLRATRDLFTTDLEKLVIDDKAAFDRVVGFVSHYMPSFTNSVEMYRSEEPIFDAYGIEIEINRALQRKVELPSGGYLIIDKTEALTTVDVNTGRFVGSTTQEETILQTNIEAAEELVYQLRLRNIGGIIIIDFIDMDNPKHRERVHRALAEALKKDKVTSNALAISELGLVEMTRKRVRESLVQYLCEPCSYCEGKGFVKSKETVAYEILREIKREAPVLSGKDVYVYANNEVIDMLRFAEKQALREIEETTSKKLHLLWEEGTHVEQFSVSDKPKVNKTP